MPVVGYSFMGSDGVRPSGTVTFLFTDIEGSTRRWEVDADAMRIELASHDEVLRATIEGHDGWLFKHTGDGVCAAFASARSAVVAAIDAQHRLGLPVRMGIATGEAEQRGEDYFGPALNRAARVMAVGHGGQILVSATTAALVSGVDLWDLGEHRLRDLTGVERLFQVRSEDLRVEFPRLRSLDAVPGNLPAQPTSFVGREAEVGELVGLVRSHRLVTLTGVGGVGKTRLAVQVAAEMVPDFVDGVWLVELAEVSDPAAVPDAVASALALTPQPAMSPTDSVVQSLADRRALLVLDNCEHVLSAAADLIGAVVASSPLVTVLVTSREGTRFPGEHVWSVPSLDFRAGTESEAVVLFVERARAVESGFGLADDVDAAAVVEICERLDGIALAIELAAARMASMTPREVRDRLDDRFRLLAGGRWGLERHQTLRHAVQWSYELLDDDERVVLNRCAVFAGGFDLPSAIEVAGLGDVDEYEMLDLLDSLVRKSLVTVNREHGRTRYTMLETIRQFADEQRAVAGEGASIRDRHARHFANGVIFNFERWASPDQRSVSEWYGLELGNLRTAFQWAKTQGDLDVAATIAGQAAFPAAYCQWFEPAGWCVELLESPGIGEHRLLKWLYMGAAQQGFVADPETAIRYSEAGLRLVASGFDRVPHELERVSGGVAQLFAGRPERWVEIAREISDSPHDDLRAGAVSVVWTLATIGEFGEAMRLADDMLVLAEKTGVPWTISYAHAAIGKAFAKADTARAFASLRTAVSVAREGKCRMFEAAFSRDLAGLEASDGDVRTALESLDHVIDEFYQTSDTTNLAPTLGYLVTLLDRIERFNEAATLYGATTRHRSAMAMVAGLSEETERLRTILGPDVYARCEAEGATMDTRQAVEFAHAEIRAALDDLPETE